MAANTVGINHPLIKHLAQLKANRDYRFECKKVVVEGEKLIHDLCKTVGYEHLIVLDSISMPNPVDKAHVTLVSEEVMKKITHLPSPPSMIAEFPMPKESTLEGLKWIVVFDRLQDPGNVGALLRSALALDWEGAFLIESVDPFNDKVLRAAREAAFHLPFKIGTREEFFKLAASQNWQIYRADMKGDRPEKIVQGALVIGNEGQGVHEAFKNYKAFTIPMSDKLDSLNASCAGSILMYALKGV